MLHNLSYHNSDGSIASNGRGHLLIKLQCVLIYGICTDCFITEMSRAGKREGLSVQLKNQVKKYPLQEGDQSCTTITGGCDPSASFWGEVFFRTY